MANKVFISRAALSLLDKLTKKGIFRGDAFIQVDTFFHYTPGTTAQYIGRKESTVSKYKKKYVGGYRKNKIKPKKKKLWGKVHSEAELKNAWWNQPRKKTNGI